MAKVEAANRNRMEVEYAALLNGYENEGEDVPMSLSKSNSSKRGKKTVAGPRLMGIVFVHKFTKLGHT